MAVFKNIIIGLVLIALAVLYSHSHLPQANAACDFNQAANTLCNPLEQRDIKDLALKVLSYIMGIIALVSIVMIVIAGARMVASGGNETAIKDSKKMAWAAAMGFALALLSYSIIAIVRNALF